MKKKFVTLLTSLILGGAILYGLAACDGGSGKLTYETVTMNGIEVGYSVVGTTDNYGIKTVTVPEEYRGLPVTEIGEGAFASCLKLSSITIPSTVTKIGNNAFSGCKNLSNVNYTGDVAGWCGIKFADSSSNPTNYTKKLKINNKLVTEVDIPETVTYLNNYTFYNCVDIKSVTLPEKLERIGKGTFSNCNALESVTIPTGVKSIENEAFSNCLALKEINFNATGCNDLLFENYVFSRAGQSGDGITVNIGANVIRIPDYLFCPKDGSVTVNGITGESSTYVPKIKNVVFASGSKCVLIGDNAFCYCNDLASVNLPSSLKTINAYAFSNCKKLAEVTIPAAVTQIGVKAFGGCNSTMRTVFADKDGWVRLRESDGKSGGSVSSEDLNDPVNATKLLQETYLDSRYYGYNWKKI